MQGENLQTVFSAIYRKRLWDDGESRPGVRFVQCDITRDPLPRVDLILCRDVLAHLAFAEISAALANFKRSGSHWFLTNTFIGREENIDSKTMGGISGLSGQQKTHSGHRADHRRANTRCAAAGYRRTGPPRSGATGRVVRGHHRTERETG